jgi:hypothetical protein
VKCIRDTTRKSARIEVNRVFLNTVSDRPYVPLTPSIPSVTYEMKIKIVN